MNSVTKKRRTNKKRSEKHVTSGIHRAAERVGIKREPHLDKTPVMLPKYEVQRINRLLARAVDKALDAAPREIPPMYGRVGADAAIDAVRDIRMVRDFLAAAMEGGAL